MLEMLKVSKMFVKIAPHCKNTMFWPQNWRDFHHFRKFSRMKAINGKKKLFNSGEVTVIRLD